MSPLVFQGSVGSIRLFLYKRTTELAGSSTAAINPVFGGAGVVLLLGSSGFFWVLLVFFCVIEHQKKRQAGRNEGQRGGGGNTQTQKRAAAHKNSALIAETQKRAHQLCGPGGCLLSKIGNHGSFHFRS